ncbi:MAG: OmpA family protein [Magnetococcales bacterium]|nr:OmpA family protein [Magnetococcales bacterium]
MTLLKRQLIFGVCLLSGLCMTASLHAEAPSIQAKTEPPTRPLPADWRQSDNDKDGIPLVRDHCAHTPPGAEVDNRGCALDSDRDGVLDKDDLCPNTPFGAPVDVHGCPLDSDGDGVTDLLDRCPDTPHGVKVDKVGCPLDADGDGVHDHLDACPGTPAGAAVDARGCWVIANLNFASGSWTIPATAHESLRSVTAILKRNPDLRVVIQGHTDNVGGEAYNQDLSLKRAKAVQDHFVAEGVAVDRMSVTGYGLIQPVATNDSPEGRAQNRRVVLDIPAEKKLQEPPGH